MILFDVIWFGIIWYYIIFLYYIWLYYVLLVLSVVSYYIKICMCIYKNIVYI